MRRHQALENTEEKLAQIISAPRTPWPLVLMCYVCHVPGQPLADLRGKALHIWGLGFHASAWNVADTAALSITAVNLIARADRLRQGLLSLNYLRSRNGGHDSTLLTWL